MELDAIMQAVGSLGFPIVVCGALGWYIVKHEEQQRQEMSALRETIVQNTETVRDFRGLLQALMDAIRGD